MSGISRRLFLTSGAGAFGATLVAGCTSSSSNSSSSSGTASAGSGGGGGTLQAAISAEPSDFDPDRFQGGVGEYFWANVFERLYQENQTGTVVPWLATGYQPSADGKTHTFDLRPGVKFHDGTAMTADDVVYSFERFAAKTNPNSSELVGFVSAKALSPTKVAITLAEFDAAFIANGGYTFILPKAYLTRVGDAGFAAKPVGTGPFAFGGQQVNSYFTLNRFSDYWGTKPGFASVNVNIVPQDSTRVAQLQAGQVDFIAQVPPQNVVTLKEASGTTVVTTVDGDGIWIGVNCRSAKGSPWLDPRVRQAMAHAIDSKTILASVADGLGKLSAGLLPSEPGFASSGLSQLEYDPDMAKSLLKQAGYANGFTIPFSAPVNGRVPYSEQVAQAVQGYWSKVGINAKTSIQSYDAWIKATQAGSPFGAYFVVFGAQSNDCQFRMTLSLGTDQPVSNVADPHMDTLIKAVQTQRDPNVRQQAIVTAWQYAIRTMAFQLPLFEASEAFAFKSDKVSWQPWFGQAATIFQNVRPA